MTEEQDPYAYPGSNVLRNKPGIVVAELLAEFEYEQSAKRMQELHATPIEGKFDLDHLKAIHKAIFQDVYDWAGEIRTVSIIKGNTRFAEPDYIAAEAAKLSAAVANENNLRGLQKRQFADRLAHYYAEWNALHPFREGNGRTTRELMGEIARQAGYEFDQTRIDNSKGRWNEAARQSFAGRLQPVSEIFWEAVRPTRSLAFETLSQQEALAKHPELEGTYEGLARLKAAYQAHFPGDAEKQNQCTAQATAQILRTLDTGSVLQTRQADPAPAGPERANQALGDKISADRQR